MVDDDWPSTILEMIYQVVFLQNTDENVVIKPIIRCKKPKSIARLLTEVPSTAFESRSLTVH